MKLSELLNEYGDITLSDNAIESIRKDLDVIPCPSWIRKENKTYYAIYTEGDIAENQYGGHDKDKDRLAIGNFFQTKEEAEFEVERRKIEAKLLSLGGSRNGEYGIGGTKYLIDYHCGNLSVVGQENNFINQGVIYFKDRDILMNAIKIIGEKRIKKYLFHIEEKDEE